MTIRGCVDKIVPQVSSHIKESQMNIFRITATILPVTFLLACGGGGGSAGAITPEPLPSLPVENAQRAISLVGGSEVMPAMTSMEIEQAVQMRADAADTLIFSDIVQVSRTQVDRRTVTCDGFICNGTITDGTNTYEVTISLNDFGGTPEINGENLVGYNERYSLVMMDRGVTLGQGRAAGRLGDVSFQYQSYGGWLDNSVFAVESEMATDGNDTLIWLNSYSFGDASGTKPTATASWDGVMVGANARGHVIQGDMAASFVIANPNEIRVFEFSNIINLDTGQEVSGMRWPTIPLTDSGTFKSANGDIEGTFYGANHEEMGGIFNRNDIIGAFAGAK